MRCIDSQEIFILKENCLGFFFSRKCIFFFAIYCTQHAFDSWYSVRREGDSSSSFKHIKYKSQLTQVNYNLGAAQNAFLYITSNLSITNYTQTISAGFLLQNNSTIKQLYTTIILILLPQKIIVCTGKSGMTHQTMCNKCRAPVLYTMNWINKLSTYRLSQFITQHSTFVFLYIYINIFHTKNYYYNLLYYKALYYFCRSITHICMNYECGVSESVWGMAHWCTFFHSLCTKYAHIFLLIRCCAHVQLKSCCFWNWMTSHFYDYIFLPCYICILYLYNGVCIIIVECVACFFLILGWGNIIQYALCKVLYFLYALYMTQTTIM